VRHKKKKGTFIRKYNENYLKFGFILCPGTEQLQKLQCVLCAVVLGNEAMKPSRLLRHLNIKHSELMSDPTEFFMRKRVALKIGKQVLTQTPTIDKSLLASFYLVALQIVRCK
jgi:hypothetical protein